MMESSAQPRSVITAEAGRHVLSLTDGEAASRGGRSRDRTLPSWGRASSVRVFTRQAATLLAAGFALDRVLSIVSDLLDDGAMGGVVEEVQAGVRQGQALATALASHPRFFGDFYRGVIAAGERSGALAGAFQRLAEYLDRQADLRSRLMGALMYPALMVGAGSVAVLVLLLFVIPRFALILGDIGGELPWTARTLIWLGNLVGAGWWIAVLLLGAAVAAVRLQRQTESGRRIQDSLLHRVAIVGPLRGRLATERVARTVAGALHSGIPLLDALEIAAHAAADAAFRRELERAGEAVRRGERLSASLRRGRVVPELAVQMIAAGEESGRLGDLLDHVATAYRAETEQRLRNLVAVVEPAIIVVFGSLVGFVALALLQTVYGIGTSF